MDGAANFSQCRRPRRVRGSRIASRPAARLVLGLVWCGTFLTPTSVLSQAPALVTSGTTARGTLAVEPLAAAEASLPAPTTHATILNPSQGNVVTSSATIEEALNRRGSISFRKTAISEVVFLMSDLWKINIVAGDSVGGEVSGVFHDAPLRDVLSSTLAASGFGYRQVGDSLVVLPLDQITAFGTTSPSSNDTGVALGIGGIVQNDIAYFTMQYTDAELLAEPLKVALSSTTIVAVYPEENRLMVKGTLDEIRIATDAIEQLDIPRQQVRITALIYDVSLDEIEKLGVNWTRSIYNPNAATGTAVGASATGLARQNFTATAEVTSLGATGTSLALKSLSNNFDAVLLLEALDQNTEAKLLANPSITVGDRHEASMQIVKRLPIVAATGTGGGAANPLNQVTFVDAGVILRVTPRISRDQTIEMIVNPEFSVQSGSTGGYPIIDSRTAQTTVRINNGHTFALGGLRQKSVTEQTNGVPWLKDRKYIGVLFRSHNTQVRESELIVFLKPELVDPYFDGMMRERRAACIANQELDAIPYASHCPNTPYCKDPHCPNHRPRPRINGGTRELEMLGGEGFDNVWVPASPGGYPMDVLESSGEDAAIDALPNPVDRLGPQANGRDIDSGYRVVQQPSPWRANTVNQSGSGSSDALPPVHVEPLLRR